MTEAKEVEVQPHQQRVVEEKTELDSRLEKLKAFIETEKFQSLSFDERWDLRAQRAVMSEYSDILRRRIAAWG